MDNRVGSLDNVESVESDGTLPTKGVEVLGTLGKGSRNGNLMMVNKDIRMLWPKQVCVLVEASGHVWPGHDEGSDGVLETRVGTTDDGKE